MNEKLVDSVIHDLSRHRDRSAIIEDVCMCGGLRWQQAEQFIQRVEAEHAGAIERGQTPLLIFLSLGLIVIGAIMLFIFNYGMGVFQVLLLTELLGTRTVWYRLASSVVAVALLIGGLINLWKTTRRYLHS